MNQFPHDPGEFSDPSSIDPDAYLAQKQAEADEDNAAMAEIDAGQVAAEQVVLDALDKAGFNTAPIRKVQSIIAPGQRLAVSIDEMFPMRDELFNNQCYDEGEAVQGAIAASLAIQDIAYERYLTEGSSPDRQSATKRQQQIEIYANEHLSPEQKEQFLAAIEEVFPGVEGLKPDSPDTAVSIQKYDERERESSELMHASLALKEVAIKAIDDAIMELGLGQHDDLGSVISAIAASVTRLHVVETSTFSTETRELTERASGSILNVLTRSRAKKMGWSDDQFNMVIGRVRASLQNPESE